MEATSSMLSAMRATKVVRLTAAMAKEESGTFSEHEGRKLPQAHEICKKQCCFSGLCAAWPSMQSAAAMWSADVASEEMRPARLKQAARAQNDDEWKTSSDHSSLPAPCPLSNRPLSSSAAFRALSQVMEPSRLS